MQPITGNAMITNSHQYGRPVFRAWYAKHSWMTNTSAARIGMLPSSIHATACRSRRRRARPNLGESIAPNPATDKCADARLSGMRDDPDASLKDEGGRMKDDLRMGRSV